MILRNRLPGVHRFLRPLALSRSSAGLLCRLLLAFCCRPGRMAACQAALLPRTDVRHPAAIGRFLGRQRWAKGDWLIPLRSQLLAQLRPAPGTFFFLVDQSLFSKQGDQTPNTYSTGNRTRRPRKGRRYSTKKQKAKRCHAFVYGLLLTPQGVRIPFRKSYYTAAYCQQQGLVYRTQTELGAELIRELPPLPAGAQVVVLGDTAFEAQCVQRVCRERQFSWITPCNAERVLEGPKPRPRVRSLIKQSATLRFVAVEVHPDRDPYASQRRWSRSARDRRNQGRTYWVCRQKLTVHSVGEVLVVLSTAQKPIPGEPLHEPKMLLASDVTLTARAVVWQYTLRWQIELFFKECKSHLGMGQYRFRDFVRVERWMDVALATYLYLEWFRWRKLKSGKLPAAEKAWWQQQRTAGLCAAVRCQREEQELDWLHDRLQTPGGCTRLRRLLRASRPRVLRQPRDTEAA
jgi:hypothetical protein